MMTFINGCFWTLILILIELECFQCKPKRNDNSEAVTEEPDQDVAEERKRIAEGCNDQIIVQGFSKQFTTLHVKTCKLNTFFAV